jgi:hypothetical protein
MLELIAIIVSFLLFHVLLGVYTYFLLLRQGHGVAAVQQLPMDPALNSYRQPLEWTVCDTMVCCPELRNYAWR